MSRNYLAVCSRHNLHRALHAAALRQSRFLHGKFFLLTSSCSCRYEFCAIITGPLINATPMSCRTLQWLREPKTSIQCSTSWYMEQLMVSWKQQTEGATILPSIKCYFYTLKPSLVMLPKSKSIWYCNGLVASIVSATLASLFHLLFEAKKNKTFFGIKGPVRKI